LTCVVPHQKANQHICVQCSHLKSARNFRVTRASIF
jgi:hypothetical protein